MLAAALAERRRAERALSESELRFRAIFDQTLQFMGLLSPDGTVLEANKTALDFIAASNKRIAAMETKATKQISRKAA